MGGVSSTFLALSMSADAFAVSVATGAARSRPTFWEALRTGLVFGVVEALTPIIGWLFGYAASSFITEIDHWIAFAILSYLGIRMVRESVRDRPEEEPVETCQTLPMMAFTALATSIDAMAVGVTLAFLDTNILMVAAAIGSATCVMVTLGIYTGHLIGQRIGRVAETLGGLGLIAIGTHILLQHLGYL